jgi:hypothetical protein
MNSLFTFGCSYTAEYDEKMSSNYKKYKEFRGDFPKSWPMLLSDLLSLELINYGQGAAGNDEIFITFCQKCNDFKKNDVVIIGWTFIERYRIAVGNKKNDWQRLGPGKINESRISQNTHDEITINRTLRPYLFQIYDYMKIMDKLAELIGFKLYYWAFIDDFYNFSQELIKQEKFLLCNQMKDKYYNCFRIAGDNGNQTISEETNGYIDDVHMGEKGHKVLAELFHNHIMNYKQI